MNDDSCGPELDPRDAPALALGLPIGVPPPASDRQIADGHSVAERLRVFRIEGRPPRQPVRQPDLLARVLDCLDEGLMVCDRAGRMICQNAALKAFLAAEPESGRILEEFEVLARSVFLVAQNRAAEGKAEEMTCLVRQVRTVRREYRLRGIYLGENVLDGEPAVLVVINPCGPEAMTDEVLRKDFGLTAQEVRVARLVAEGKRNQEIADLLSLSRHTIRHHVGHILLKLGAHTRAEVGPILLQGSAPRMHS